jgi:hypothetical protein
LTSIVNGWYDASDGDAEAAAQAGDLPIPSVK